METASNVIPECHFDRSKLFYPLVTHYVVALVAFKELAGHGLVRRMLSISEELGISPEAALLELNARLEKPMPSAAAKRTKDFEVMPPLELASRVRTPVPVNVNSFADEVYDNGKYLARYWAQAALSLVTSAFELSRSRGHANSDPLWQFLRHCRNAAGHGNRFNVHEKPGEPWRPAQWRSLEITPSMHGQVLFQELLEPGAPHFLKPGDPVMLLWDIEQAYPNLRP